jgi:hypothetical protein
LSKKKKGKPTTPIVDGGGGSSLEHPSNSYKDCNQEQRNPYEKINTVIACVGLFVLIIYTSFSGCMSCEMVKANYLAAHNFELSERPSVTLGRKDGTIADFTVPKDLSANRPIGLKLYLQNGGRSPALSLNIGLGTSPLNLLAAGHGPSKQPFQPQGGMFHHLVRSRSKDGKSSSDTGGISIPPQSEYVHIIPNQFSQEQWQRTLNGEIAPMVEVMFDYCDEFGNYYCHWISLFYQGPPVNTFLELNDNDCANLYYYPPVGTDQVFLLPCEQPKEREEREKKEREKMIEDAANAAPLPTATATR